MFSKQADIMHEGSKNGTIVIYYNKEEIKAKPSANVYPVVPTPFVPILSILTPP